MYSRVFLFCFILICSAKQNLFAQQIKGMIQDREAKAPLSGVQLVNIYNNATTFTDSLGNFTLAAKKGELVEVHYAGYQLTRFRLSMGKVPSYFKLYLDKITVLNTDQYASSDLTAYQIDSIKTRKLYSSALDYPGMTTFEKIESPFTALSRSNQEKWAFQSNYAMFEREKYIDFTFNEDLVRKLTGLEGTDLTVFMKRYRPSYEALRAMSQYDYYTYVRRMAERFRKLGKPGTPRNSG